jgi:hypothetical protein
MHITPIHEHQAAGSRFTREPVQAGMARRYELAGDARPGDVLALAGGALVHDLNENGLVDGHDARVERGVDWPPPRGALVDVRA